MHAFGLEAEITADDGDCSRRMKLPQETRVIAEDGPKALLGFSLRDNIDNFPPKFGGVFRFGFEVEEIGGGDVGVDAAGGSGAGPAHGGDGKRTMEGSEHYSFGGATGPALPEVPLFGVDVLQSDGLHFGGAPFYGFPGFGAAGDAGPNFIAEFGEELEGGGVHGGVAGDFDEAGFCGVSFRVFLRR